MVQPFWKAAWQFLTRLSIQLPKDPEFPLLCICPKEMKTHTITHTHTYTHTHTHCNPWTIAHQPPQSMGFFRQEYWSGLPFTPPGDLPDSGIKPASPMSPALQVDS